MSVIAKFYSDTNFTHAWNELLGMNIDISERGYSEIAFDEDEYFTKQEEIKHVVYDWAGEIIS